jgi:hypothetical protein
VKKDFKQEVKDLEAAMRAFKNTDLEDETDDFEKFIKKKII